MTKSSTYVMDITKLKHLDDIKRIRLEFGVTVAHILYPFMLKFWKVGL